MAATAAPACFVLSACDELLLAPGWLFANVNLPQPLLLISQSCWIPLGAVTRGGKVPFPSEMLGLALGWSSVPIPSLWLLSGSSFPHLELCSGPAVSRFYHLPVFSRCSADWAVPSAWPSSAPVPDWGEWCCWQSCFRLCWWRAQLPKCDLGSHPSLRHACAHTRLLLPH